MPNPWTAFNFLVEISVGGRNSGHICGAAFAECDGLEMNMQPKTIREGGNNLRQIHLTGPVTYGQLTLRRGMTEDFGLWRWFERVQEPGGQSLRADAEVIMLAEDGNEAQPRARFLLSRCLPVKVRAPALNAKEGQVAIEELQLVYEMLTWMPPGK